MFEKKFLAAMTLGLVDPCLISVDDILDVSFC